MELDIHPENLSYDCSRHVIQSRNINKRFRYSSISRREQSPTNINKFLRSMFKLRKREEERRKSETEKDQTKGRRGGIEKSDQKASNLVKRGATFDEGRKLLVSDELKRVREGRQSSGLSSDGKLSS